MILKSKIMKKLFFIIVSIVMVALFSSCSKNDDEESIDISDRTMHVGDSIKINGASNLFSQNDFIAYVNGSFIKAVHVGETNIKCGNENIKILVIPYSTLFNEPIIHWGCSIDYVKNNQALGILESDKTASNSKYDRILSYKNVGKPESVSYAFKNNKLVITQVELSRIYVNEAKVFLMERYATKLVSYNNFLLIGSDGYTETNSRTVVSLFYTSSSVVVEYVPSSSI